MVTVSQTLLDMMDTTTNSERPVFRERAKITFADDTTIELDSGQFSASENTITDAAGASSFPLGVAVSKGIQLNISNAEDEETGEQPFSSYYFYGARIHLWIEVDLTDGTTEIIEVGWFTVTSPEEYGSTISVTAFDDMYRADQPIDSDTFGSATEISLLNATQTICSKVGIPYSQSSFKNSRKTVSVSLFTESQMTYRQALGYIAMLAGGNARLNRNGSLEILSYSTEKKLSSSKNTLNSWTELSMDTEDITLTGISIDGHIEKTITNEDGETEIEEVETTFHNTGYADGYAITLENPLMEGREQEFLDAIWNVIGNISFRKFEGDHIENPLIEFMDEVYVVDRKGNSHYSIVTDITYTFYGATNIKNSAESAARISSSYGNPNTSTEKKLSKMIYAERSARETAIKNLKESLAQTGDGVFTYSTVQSDGSEILYLYNVKSDKTPPYQDSTVIIKITGSALGISHGLRDGGDPTNEDDYNFDTGYNFATDTAILNALYANGIDADKIHIKNLSLNDIGSVGGRNLLKGTRDFSDSTFLISNRDHVSFEERDGFKVLCFDTTQSENETNYVFFSLLRESQPIYSIPVGTEYITISFFAKVESRSYDQTKSDIRLQINDVFGTASSNYEVNSTQMHYGTYVELFSIPSEFCKVYVTIKIEKNSDVKYERSITANVLSKSKVYIYGIKIEAGSVPTDWTPAPEDSEYAIEAVNEKVQSVDLQINGSNGITAQVKKAQETADAKISSSEISLSVSNSGTSSTIQLKAGDKTSNASINITGFVTFSNIKDGKTVISGSNLLTGNICGRTIILSNSTSYNISSNQNLSNAKYSYLQIINSGIYIRGQSYTSKTYKNSFRVNLTDDSGKIVGNANMKAGKYNVHPVIEIDTNSINAYDSYRNVSTGEGFISSGIIINPRYGITFYNENQKDDSVSRGIRFPNITGCFNGIKNKNPCIVNGNAYLKSIYLDTPDRIRLGNGSSVLKINSKGKVIPADGLSKSFDVITKLTSKKYYYYKLTFKNGLLTKVK